MSKIFVSSTSVDLKDHRKVVDDTLRRMKEESVVMEFFGSRSEDAHQVCLGEIENCQMFIGIYAHRYGFCPDDSGLSITEMEFDHAQKCGLAVLCYTVQDDFAWSPKFIEHTAAEQLAAFKNKINRLVRSTFTTPDDLAKQVAADLARELKTRHDPAPAASVWQQKIIANKPFSPPAFMEDSRDAVIQELRELTAGAHKTVVLHAEGGTGKTSILAKFCERHGNDYPHIVWINCGQQTVVHAFAGDFKLVDALRPAMPRWRDDWEAPQKFEHLVDTLAAEGRSGLLLLDNANDKAQLADCRRFFEENLARWTCLITSRDPKTGFRQVLHVEPLEPDFAQKLFVRHWLGDGAQPSADDAERLRRLLARIRYHALLTETLAKHLRACNLEGNTVRLEDLLRRLSTEGILGLPRTDAVEVEWQGAVGTPLQILEQLFDLAQLDEAQQTRLLQLALLPDAPLPMYLLLPVFGIARDAEPERYEAFKAELENLAARGWLDFAKGAGYSTHSLVGEFVRGRLLPDFKRCLPVVERLIKILEDWKITHSKPFLPLAEAVLEHLGGEENLKITDLACALADGHRAIGEMPNAQIFYKIFYDITEKLATANPDSEQIQHDWAVANSRMGDLTLALGQPAEAKRFFEKHYELSEKLAAANPNSEQTQRDWAVANSRMGDLTLALGQSAEAKRYFEKYLEISEKLAVASPDSEQNQREWAVANSQMGNLALVLGRPAEAKRFFEKHLETSEKLAAANPDSELIQRDWAVANSKMGDLALALGQPVEAKRFFEKDHEISEKLSAANPDSEQIQCEWAVSNSRLGDLALSLGQPAEAKRFSEYTLDIFQKLAVTNPDSELIQRGWALALTNLGIIEIQSGGDTARARACLQQSLEILEARSVLNPLSADLKKNVEAVRGHLSRL